MIKTLFRGALTLAKRKTVPFNIYNWQARYSLSNRPNAYFCHEKPTPPPASMTAITVDEVGVRVREERVGEEEVEVVETEGAVSILDRVEGVKAANGQLYVLSFTCNKCDTKVIRSFSKHAYHKGVVLVRCGGCENIHLVADNIGWFEDKPVNVETMHPELKRIQDPLLIAQFLERAFGTQEKGK